MSQTPRQRLFTNEYRIGDEVAIIRERHGWHDGRTIGKIVQMDAYSAVVKTSDNKFVIEHPRDIRKIG